jgi:hypothetical protein
LLAVAARGDSRLALTGIDTTVAFCLHQVPGVLAQADSAGMRDRLHPDPIPGDPARNAEWHRLMDSELRHLFEAARTTFARDLTGMDPRSGEIEFPAQHLMAWMSAVNQARVVLSEQHQLDALDMRRDEFTPGSPRDAALLQVQVLGYVLQVLVEHTIEGA